MIVVLKKNVAKADLERLLAKLREQQCDYLLYENGEPVLKIKSKQNLLSNDFFLSQPGVQAVFRITPAYSLAARKSPEQVTSIPIGQQRIDAQTFTIIAGPCAVESEDQIMEIAQRLSQSGIRFLRGGAFKPRTSPYTFQGLGLEGLKLLRKAADRFQMSIVTEAISSSDVPVVSEYADVLQIGTRNMQNFRLLKTAGKQKRPVLLKRGMNATIEEFLLAAEHILNEGNPNVILCERGIRTFETATRNTLDISAVPLIKELSHLPIFVDPSHASGKRSLILPLSRAALAAGADGLLIEVHDQAEKAKSDGPQSINFSTFDNLLSSLKAMAPLMGKGLQ
ncbi:MAG: 3-deoxy-7-phosphoheptulonate synthase [Acidobacteria bacterium]|nr:MAG: 3-deoxy-7-phosphoheptulonate synthase [Acidobacteriota bacterium]